MACGGLLPLLAAATSPNSELEIQDTTNQEITIHEAVSFLQRFVELADVFVFISGISFNELEQEKNMPSGGILRQSLRLVATMAVRNILASRVALRERGFNEETAKHKEKFAAILEFVGNAIESVGYYHSTIQSSLSFQKDPAKGIANPDRLLQEIDTQRLKGLIYRDMEEVRQAQFLALSVVYLLSVLMVSRYRDILEPSTSPSPFFDTNSDSSTRRVSSNSFKPSIHLVTAQNLVDSIQNKTTRASSSTGTPEKRSDSNGVVEKSPEEKRYIPSQQNKTAEAEKQESGISSIRTTEDSMTTIPDGEKYAEEHLASIHNVKQVDSGARRTYLTEKLKQSLESVAPLLREIMTDFRSFLQKTLLGTHGRIYSGS